MRGLCRLLCLALVAIPLKGGAATAAARDTLYTYDLTPLLRGDLNDPARRRAVWDEMQLVASVQGIVNRQRPKLYVYLVGDKGRIDRYWMDQLRQPGEWLARAEIVPIRSPEQLIATFRRAIRGVVTWDESVPATSNVASTISGIERAVVLRHDPAPGSLFDRLVHAADGSKLPVVVRLFEASGEPLFTGHGTIPGTALASSGSAKCDAYLWAAEKYLKTGRCDASKLAFYPDAYWLTKSPGIPADRTLLCNHDYFIAHRGFFFDLSPWDDEAPDDDRGQRPGTDGATLRAVLRIAYDAAHGRVIHIGGFIPWDQKYTDFTGGKHGGVPTEWRYAEILSCYNAYMDADAPGLHAMANASIYQHYPLAPSYPQRNLPSLESLADKGYLVEQAGGQQGAGEREHTDLSRHRPLVAPKVYVSIYVGDYDSAAWLYQRLPDLWNDPARGSIPLGWAFNPTLQERFPVGLALTRKTATPNDSFVTGDSGAGYLNPGYLAPPRTWSGLPSGIAAWEAHSAPLYRRWGLSVTGFVIDGYAPPMTDAVKQAYARFSSGGVVAQKVPDSSLVHGVPFLRMGPDLTGTAEQGAETIARNAPKQAPGFAIYRTILWSPTGHKRMFERLKELRPDIEVVDPHTLMLLLKLRLEAGSG